MNSSEKRWSIRKQVEMDVDLCFRGQVWLGCKSQDVSMGGMFLNFSRRKFPKNCNVDIIVRLQDEQGERSSHMFQAQVVRNTDSGLGLSFKDFKIRDFRMLQDVLQLEPPADLDARAMH